MAVAEQIETQQGARQAWRGFDHQYIAGEWRAGTAGGANRDVDPYAGETLAEIPLAGADDLDAAYRAAKEAQPACAAAMPMERAAVQRGPRRYPRSAAGILGPGAGRLTLLMELE